MTATEPDANESRMHLEAMLYLLGDPALDRDAFEARLLSEPQLGEILANAVVLFHSLRSSNLKRLAVRPTRVSPAASQVKNAFRRGLFVPTVAASLFIACILGWQSFVRIQTGKSNSQISASLNRVVLAWGDLQSDTEDSILVPETTVSEFVPALSLADSFAESEVPDWLVLAATNNSDGNDSGDGKVFLQ